MEEESDKLERRDVESRSDEADEAQRSLTCFSD
jgi:hypothetical protein